MVSFLSDAFFQGWILLMMTKFWKPIGSSKLIRHSRWDFFVPVNNSTGRGIPQPPSTGRLQLLCQCFIQAMRGSTQQLSNWLARPAHADTLASTSATGWLQSRKFRYVDKIMYQDLNSPAKIILVLLSLVFDRLLFGHFDHVVSRKNKVPFRMAIGNWELMHEGFPKHLRIETARMK